MLFNRRGSATDGEAEPRHHKDVHAPDPLQLPGKLPVPASASMLNPQALRQAAQGFVFVALVIIFGAYAMQVWSRGTEAARRKVCRSHLHMLGLSLQMYADDYDGTLPPPGGDLMRQSFTYVEDPRWFICPSDDTSLPAIRRLKSGELLSVTSYTYRPPEMRYPDVHPDPVGFALMWDTNGGVSTGFHRKGGNVLYLDGHLTWQPLRNWSAADWPWL